MVIIIRNSSHINIKTVSLRAPKAEKNQTGIRFGSISPLPMRRDQTIVRPPTPKKFPSILQVSWIDDSNRRFVKNIGIEHLLYPEDVSDGNAIVFEIVAPGVVNVFIENYPINL